MPNLEDDRLDYLAETNPDAYKEEMRTRGVAEEAAKRRREGKSAPFPPAPLPEGQTGVIVLSGYSRVDMPTGSGWVVEGGWMDK